jgi:hypothetical protein
MFWTRLSRRGFWSYGGRDETGHLHSTFGKAGVSSFCSSRASHPRLGPPWKGCVPARSLMPMSKHLRIYPSYPAGKTGRVDDPATALLRLLST